MVRVCQFADDDVDECRPCGFDMCATSETSFGSPFNFWSQAKVEMLASAISVALVCPEVNNVLDILSALTDDPHAQD